MKDEQDIIITLGKMNNRYERFNLVDDLMEPLRPIVDIIAYNSMKNDKYFTPEHRRKLVSILNMKIMYREKKMYMCLSLIHISEPRD